MRVAGTSIFADGPKHVVLNDTEKTVLIKAADILKQIISLRGDDDDEIGVDIFLAEHLCRDLRNVGSVHINDEQEV